MNVEAIWSCAIARAGTWPSTVGTLVTAVLVSDSLLMAWNTKEPVLLDCSHRRS